ncbi:hypothetical protein QYE76_027203 [Lolium multiflorum]|uniref:Reverse transcriptase Ty1/copia-type domain-containing protein n=1 Tax=Lolium multiflorum TaxID=4521 RepID=A0AAD8VES7_LOLMU|nr:hypothetical protein QYE76_027203 [Lolium multiflorum]
MRWPRRALGHFCSWPRRAADAHACAWRGRRFSWPGLCQAPGCDAHARACSADTNNDGLLSPAAPTPVSPVSQTATPPVSSPATTTSVPEISPPVSSAAPVPSPTGPVTRLRRGITQPKQRTDGTVAWNCILQAYSASKHTQEPRDYKEALRLPHWRDAMEAEFSALQDTGTWRLVPPVPGVNLIDSRWIFKVKLHADGSIERYKARLVAKGYKQRYGLDYDETFSPVVKPATIRLLLGMALSHRWYLRQLDIQNAFLHGFLNEEVYMRQPPGFVDSARPDHYCRLIKSLYGLKQAPRAWHARLSSVLGSLGFFPSVTDTSLFILRRPDVTIFLLVYVDDIIVLSSLEGAIPRLIGKLRSEFSVKDLGALHYFLGIEVSPPSASHLLLQQRKYALELLARAGMLKCAPVTTPMASSECLCSSDGDVLSPEEATQRRWSGPSSRCCSSNGLLFHAVARFAAYFGLSPPCLLCARVDRLFGAAHEDDDEAAGDARWLRGVLCGAHAAEISGMGYCLHHGRLVAEAADMCEGCLSSWKTKESRDGAGETTPRAAPTFGIRASWFEAVARGQSATSTADTEAERLTPYVRRARWRGMAEA